MSLLFKDLEVENEDLKERLRKIQQEQRILLDKVNGLQLQLNEVNHHSKKKNFFLTILLPVITINNKSLIVTCHFKSWPYGDQVIAPEESSILVGPLHETPNM